jgi:hypothetical protein
MKINLKKCMGEDGLIQNENEMNRPSRVNTIDIRPRQANVTDVRVRPSANFF